MNWQPIETAPTDGTKFDAWCIHPEHLGLGVRFADVQMRGDKSGFGHVVHLEGGVRWQYLDARDSDSIFPAWQPTHWRPKPPPPGEHVPPAVKVKPLTWRESYGVTRADTEIGTWYLKGKIAEFSKQPFSMVVGDDPKADVQAKHERMLSDLINITPAPVAGHTDDQAVDSFAKALDFLDWHILSTIEGGSATFGVTETYYRISTFENEWITKDMARALLRNLTDRGFCSYQNGLFTEDGYPAGSGYGITQMGIKRLNELEATDPHPATEQLSSSLIGALAILREEVIDQAQSEAGQ